ncbi:porin [Acidovorax sp. SUPP2522]|uniref:porin n=1 Tax=unclassified Acidovorax TaxID=2684926 RepID=UPI00234A94C0|nr:MULTISPECIES: porin [unclassified Acidovorax]WCM96492.1 porin [Acidovorax sp. GBBC 1281]GKT19420.1 porin [Acidovorax sp. SUPP2522]
MRPPFPFALAACGLFLSAASPAWAQDLQAYGQVRLTVNHVKTGNAGSVTEERDNASRLGFRGKEDLGDGMAALFGVEMGLDADTGAATTPAYRNSYVALRGGLGTVALGRLDSANPTGSPLYSQVTRITSFAANDAGATAVGTSILNARNRTSNAVGYQSPTWGGVNVRARYYLRGDTRTPDQENGAKSLDLGLNYAAGPWSAGIGYGRDTRPGGLLANEFSSKWQVGVRYDFGAIEPYVLLGRDAYAKASATARTDVDYWLVGSRFSAGPHALVVNVMQRDVQASVRGLRKRQQVAYTYALSKRTELQAFIDRDGIDSSRSNVAVRAVGAGVRHDF